MDEMDNFAQKFLESAQNRSKKLGISNMSKVPLTESNAMVTPMRQNSTKAKLSKGGASPSPKRQSSTKAQSRIPVSPGNRAVVSASTSNANPMAIERKGAVSIDAKENVDLALEINITTGPNVQVQVEVEEQELDGDGNVLSSIQKHQQRKQITAAEPKEQITTPSSCIRDSSRNQLHRLGALYSNPQDLSSPVHRTESCFTIEQDAERSTTTKPKPRFAKLTELANSITEWENESKTATKKDAADSNTGATAKRPQTQTMTSEAKIVGVSRRKFESPQKTNETSTVKSVLSRIEKQDNNVNKNVGNKQLKWDKTIMDSLESQGYKRRDTTHKRLEYEFKDNNKTKASEDKAKAMPATKPVSSSTVDAPSAAPAKKVDVGRGLVSGRAAIFETNSTRTTQTAAAKNQKDPAEMSLKERMALFEKNKGNALIPKAALGMAPSAKQIMADQKQPEITKQVITTPQQPMIGSTVTTSSPSHSKINNFNKASKAETQASGSGIRQTVAALLSNPATISESKIASENRKLRQQEMNVILNRFNHKEDDQPKPSAPSASPPPAPPMPDNLFNAGMRKGKRLSDEKLEISQQVRSSLEDIKRVKINPPKNGNMYPALSDIESNEYTTETYTDDDNEHQTMNRYMYSSQEEDDSYMNSDDEESNRSYDNRNKKGKRVQYADTSISSDPDYNEMDEYLDEAMSDDIGEEEEEEDNDEDGARYHGKDAKHNQKGCVSSNSFCFERKPLNRQHQTIPEDEPIAYHNSPSKFSSPIKSRLTVNPSADDNSVTLTHTVSFYRRQQTQQQSSPAVRKIIHSNTNEQSSTDDNTDVDEFSGNRRNHHEEAVVENKIRSLKRNVEIQEKQIAQASNALNTCASLVEFSGSTESVVAEWKLLTSTHSRQAALNEITRLKVERCLRPADAPKECGRLTVKEITLPLKQDYISKLSTDKIAGHHLVCLLKYNEQVLATKTIPTLPGLLSVKFPDVLHLDNVFADFKITLEIYGMTAQKEILPHEIKYHIKNKKGIIKTPKGKKPESRLIMPPKQSPAVLNTIRTPSFVQYGFVIFSLREAQRNSWTLNETSAVSPLVGTAYMKVNCALSVNIDHKAFLTMFEDISGFGAWHRRWCHLHGNILSYWKYPDDERKPPIGSIDLSTCEQQKITTAPRDMCARLNTLLIELKRPRQEDDHDSFLLQTKGDYTIVRYLLSADTKEERNEWCAHFNKTLALMRAWGNSQR